MNPHVQKTWQKTLQLIKSQLTEVSFNTWLKQITPYSIEGNIFSLAIPDDFTRGILENRYKIVIERSVKEILGSDAQVKLVIVDIEQKTNTNTTSTNSKPQNEEINASFLNPKYTFDTFVIGNSNRLAHAASVAVAESPAKSYNPLFIYGGVGLGKTHLMHAIGNYIQLQNNKSKVVYVSSETFTNELINSIKDDRNEEFRSKYRTIDVLLVDDIQFIAGKERTQEEFFHTFNTLYEANKQIIISSDRPPKEIPTLEDRLRSRFEWGLIADIAPPDLETRVAILKKKADIENIVVPDDIMLFIAKRIQSNIRELEGALIRIVAYSSLTNKEINEELANEALKDIISNSRPKQITANIIKQTVCEYYNLNFEDITANKRTKSVVYPRQIAMYLCREMTDLSLPKIGEEFGRDHTTIMHAHEKISSDLKVNPNLKGTIEEIKKKLDGK